ncbi:MAG TPA: L,D-transpeptidase family protein [Candidatus Angelobacter sp.]
MDSNFSRADWQQDGFFRLNLKHSYRLCALRETCKFILPWLILIIAIAPFSSAKSTPEAKVDQIVIVKSKRTMTLMHHSQALKTYRVALGTAPVGAKEKRGDHKTPEGNYVISGKNPHSQFHLALRISYPNTADRERARKLGVAPGGDIMIHGLMPRYAWLGSRHRETDWTDGCVAVSNAEIEEIWKLVPVGTPVKIRP